MRRHRPGPVALLLACLAPPADTMTPAARWLAPEHVRAQFAGASGLLSLGAGYGFWNGRVEPSLSYGWVPATLGGISIHTVAQRTTFAPFRAEPVPAWSWYPLALGYSAHIALGRNYDLVRERRFRGYYWPSALHFWISAGTKVRTDLPSRRPFSGMTIGAEAGTLDGYLKPVLLNESIGWSDVLTLAFTLQLHR